MTKRANNEGTICKRTRIINGKKYTYWEAKVTIGYDPITGKAKRKSYSGKSQQEVKDIMQNTSVKVNKNDFFEPSKMTVAQWADKWIDEHCNDLKYRTKKNYRSQLENHIKPELGNIKLSKLTIEMVQSFYNKLEKEGKATVKINPDTKTKETIFVPLAPKTIKNIHSILSKMLNDAIDLKYINFNASSRTKRPKVEKYEFTPLQDDNIKAFFKELEKEKYKYLFYVYLFTGMRESEAIGLTWNCIDYKAKTLRLYRQLQKRPVKDGGYTFAPLKNNETRIFSLPPFLIKIFQERYEEQEQQRLEAGPLWNGYQDESERKKALIFTNEFGSPINPKVVYKHYKRMAKNFDMSETRVHDLRHTFATISLQNGDDYKTLQRNLGHASASFTLDIYGHVTDRMKEESASRMQNYIESNIPSEDKTTENQDNKK